MLTAKDIEKIREKILKGTIRDSHGNLTHEVERKWLVTPGIQLFPNNINSSPLIQLGYPVSVKTRRAAYLSLNPEIRIRQLTRMGKVNSSSGKINYGMPADKPMPWALTLKEGSGIDRVEAEIELKDSEAQRLVFDKWPSLLSNLMHSHIINVRHSDGHIFTFINVKGKNQFGYVEVEFPSASDAKKYKIPDDMKEFIGPEVTDDSRYKMRKIWKSWNPQMNAE